MLPYDFSNQGSAYEIIFSVILDMFKFQDYYGQQQHGAGREIWGEKGRVFSMCKTWSILHGLKKHVKALSSPRRALIELWQNLQDLPLEDNTLQVTYDGKEQGAVKVQRRQTASLMLHREKSRALRKRMKNMVAWSSPEKI